MTMRLPRPRSTFLEANLAQHNGQTMDNGRGRAVKIPRGFRMLAQGCPGFAGRPWGQGPHPGILKGSRTGSGCGVGGATPLGLVGVWIALKGRRIPAQGNALGLGDIPFMRSEGTPHPG
jgi:hypothetical protein